MRLTIHVSVRGNALKFVTKLNWCLGVNEFFQSPGRWLCLALLTFVKRTWLINFFKWMWSQTALKWASFAWHRGRTTNNIAFVEKKAPYVLVQQRFKMFNTEDQTKFEQRIGRLWRERQNRPWFFDSSKIRPSQYARILKLYSLPQMKTDGYCESSEQGFTCSHIKDSIPWTITSVIANAGKLFAYSHKRISWWFTHEKFELYSNKTAEITENRFCNWNLTIYARWSFVCLSWMINC